MASSSSNAGGAPQVEAKSLSSVNFLAANPPQYPNNPTQKGHESLTLYISRVPGTRDVILSTFRPLRKNVTGEDVANSLYYVHLDHKDDTLLVPPKPIRDDGEPRSSSESARSAAAPIKRKPLPATARLTMSSHSSEASVTEPTATAAAAGGSQNLAPASASAPGQDGESKPRALPAGPPSPPPPASLPKDDSATAQRGVRFLDVPTEIGRQSNVSSPSSPAASSALSVRTHPQGPRPLATSHVEGAGAGAGAANPPPPYSPSFEAFLPPSKIRPASPPEPAEPEGHHRNHHHGQPETPAFPPPSPLTTILTSGALPQPFSLTLIRRDPTTGSQWNIGKVASLQIPQPPAAPYSVDGEQRAQHDHQKQQHQALGQPININISNSGYAKFRGMPSRKSVEEGHRLSASSLSLPGGGNGSARDLMQAAANTRSGSGDNGDDGFQRQVAMSYVLGIRAGLKSKLQSHKQGHKRGHSSSDVGHAPHQRQDSMNSVSSSSSAESNTHTPPPEILHHPSPGYRPMGYTFQSPWHSRCEFRTGNAGRSLKLRHVLPEPISLSGTPPPGSSDGNALPNQGRQVFGPGAAPISELRFNLPSADLFAKGSKRGKIAKDAQDKFNKYIRKQVQGQGYGHSSGSDDELDGGENWGGADDEMRGVGGEDAGGGNRGKRVKMGKLIVHDEGIKMLDLVVAANVGVWWSAWERMS
ncbi:hypothetical protein MKZ38_005133 [Zalerion maritima]|uniref:Uncharacterized protein n=1 Tax=Zalerion maritima TaxID=339359 RepID=A0AAD5RKE6_9PEZI|nr:hypothetical protein MKZ38_005133 [Zalerion maritima]